MWFCGDKNGMNKGKMESSSYTASLFKMIKSPWSEQATEEIIHFINQIRIPFNKNLKETRVKVTDI